jgi:hypothetical protein
MLSSQAAVIIVHASAEAEAIVGKSGLRVLDLFRPFNFVDLQFTISTVGDPFQIPGFALRFVNAGDFRALPSEIADQYLLRLLNAHDCAAALDEMEHSDVMLPTGPAPSLFAHSTAWNGAFRKQLGSALRNGEGASLDFPVGCILVASAAQVQPIVDTSNSPPEQIAKLKNVLFSMPSLPPWCRRGLPPFSTLFYRR